jgi:hypothetical protein
VSHPDEDRLVRGHVGAYETPIAQLLCILHCHLLQGKGMALRCWPLFACSSIRGGAAVGAAAASAAAGAARVVGGRVNLAARGSLGV